MRPSLPTRLDREKALVILRHVDPAQVPHVIDCVGQAGFATVEVTLNSERALETIRDLTTRFSPQELEVGAGTVLDRRAARAAIDHGARFLVTPHTDPGLVEWAARQNVPCLAGAFTASEVLSAWRAGAAAVKLFPAELAGPHGLRALRGPLHDVPLIPTGGVTADNAAEYLAAGARAVAVGSWLVGDDDLGQMAARATALRERLDAVAGIR